MGSGCDEHRQPDTRRRVQASRRGHSAAARQPRRDVRVSVAKLAGELNVNTRQARRALRHLTARELLDADERGGAVVIAAKRTTT
jgi:predicted ArsR family transcriptional regulator